MELYCTWKTQIEVLPRLVIVYGKGFKEDDMEIVNNGIGIEWLWFGLFFKCS